MFCPSCGQQQISSETKFCSRCGLPLGLIAEVLSYGGYLPQLAELGKPKKTFFSRRNGMGFALIWLIFFLFLTAIGGGVAGNEDFGAAMAPNDQADIFNLFFSFDAEALANRARRSRAARSTNRLRAARARVRCQSRGLQPSAGDLKVRARQP